MSVKASTTRKAIYDAWSMAVTPQMPPSLILQNINHVNKNSLGSGEFGFGFGLCPLVVARWANKALGCFTFSLMISKTQQ